MTRRQKEIKIVCQALYKLWKAHPKLRAGQIVTILAADTKKEIYDVTDKEFLIALKEELVK